MFADDVLVIVAWLLQLGTAVLWSVEKGGLYLQYGVTNGDIAVTSDVSKKIRDFNWCAVVLEAMFYACLWNIKLSFLIFIRRLGEKVAGLRLLWWLVTGLVVASFFTCIGVIPYQCLIPPLETLKGVSCSVVRKAIANHTCIEQCPIEYANKIRRTNLHYTSTIDVITDAAGEFWP